LRASVIFGRDALRLPLARIVVAFNPAFRGGIGVRFMRPSSK
jgi:hypothetical protein